MSMGGGRPRTPGNDGDRAEGQYEKDPWCPDWRPSQPRRRQAFGGGRTGLAQHERKLEDEEPYEPFAGFPGRRAPGFTAGRYGLGSGSLQPDDRRGEPREPPGPSGYQRSDERLREDIAQRLTEARYIDPRGVTVEVSAAKVVLQGTVPQRRMKHAIEDLVDACPGVQDIDNRIRPRG